MGRYDKITNDIIKSTFSIIKGSIDEEWANDEIVCDYIMEYETHDLEFDVETILKNGKNDGFIVDACVFDNEDEQIPIIVLQVQSSDFSNSEFYSDLYFELRDVVRHEIEHLTQRGINQKFGKYRIDNQKIRNKISNDEVPLFRYFTLGDEVDANIQGLYSKSKALRKPFQKVIDTYLDRLIEEKKIQKEHKNKIYKVWKKRIPKIGGIPKLK